MKNRTIFISTLIVLTALILLIIGSSQVSSGGGLTGTITSLGLQLAGGEQGGELAGMIGGITNPSGYITGIVTNVVIKEISKESPEAAKAAGLWNQIQPLVKSKKAKVNKDIEMSDNEFVKGELETKESVDMGEYTNREIGEINKVKISREGKDKPYSIEATEDGGSVEIGGKKYNNLAKGSKITAENGEITEADMTFTRPTTVEVGGKQIQTDKDMRVVYKDGVTEIHRKEGTVQNVMIDKQKITLDGDSIKVEGNKITGKDFTLDGKRFTGFDEVEAEVTILDEGYLLGKNTMAEDYRMIVESKDGDILLSKIGADTSGYSNSVGYQKSTFEAKGEGFSVQFKEGKQFGLDIDKGDVLKYDMEGGKVVINNGRQTVYTEKGDIILTNGEVKLRYTNIDGGTQTLVSKDSLGKSLDVEMSGLNYDIQEVLNGETDVATFATCDVKSLGPAAIIDVTGAASAGGCAGGTSINTGDTNELVGATVGKDNFLGEKIVTHGVKVGKVEGIGQGQCTNNDCLIVVTEEGNNIIQLNKRKVIIDGEEVDEIYGTYLGKESDLVHLGEEPGNTYISEDQLKQLMGKNQLEELKGLELPVAEDIGGDIQIPELDSKQKSPTQKYEEMVEEQCEKVGIDLNVIRNGGVMDGVTVQPTKTKLGTGESLYRMSFDRYKGLRAMEDLEKIGPNTYKSYTEGAIVIQKDDNTVEIKYLK